MGVADAPGAIAHDALEAAADLAEVFFGWVLPIIMLIVGIFVVNQIGLSGALGTAFSDLTSISQSGVVLVADLAAAGIWGGVGTAFFMVGGHPSVSKRTHDYAAWITRPIGGLFVGMAIGELLNALAGKVGNGSLGNLTTQMEGGVSKLASGG
jgi:hypothetical protein